MLTETSFLIQFIFGSKVKMTPSADPTKIVDNSKMKQGIKKISMRVCIIQ